MFKYTAPAPFVGQVDSHENESSSNFITGTTPLAALSIPLICSPRARVA